MAGILAGVFALILGAAMLLYGYRLFLVLLPIFGFFAGFWFGAQGIALLFGESFLASFTGLVVGFGVGLITAILSYLFYMVGVVLVAGAFGSSLAVGFMSWLGIESGFLIAIVAIVLALIVAGAVVFFNAQRYVISLITAVGGANVLVVGVMLIFQQVAVEDLSGAGNAIQPMLDGSWFWSIIWLALIAMGLVYQIRAHADFEFSYQQYQEDWG